MSERGFLRSEKGFIAIPEEKDAQKPADKPVFDRKMSDFALWACVVMLLLALPPGWPYGYYMLLRWVVCLTTGYLAYEGYKQGRRKSPVLLGAIAILFNPIVPVHMSKSDWAAADLIVAVILIFYALRRKVVHLRVERKKRRTLVIGIGLCVAALGLYATWSQYRYSTYDYPISLVSSQANFNPQQFLQNIKGELTVRGWQVKRITGKPHTYLVSYTYSRSTPLDLNRLPDQPTHPPDRNLFDDIIPSTWGWWWEVNTDVPLVRAVSNDAVLAEKYGLRSTTGDSRIGRLLRRRGNLSTSEVAADAESGNKLRLRLDPPPTLDSILLLSGELSAINPQGGLIEVKDRYGFITPIIVTASTAISSPRGSLSFDDLKVGMSVEVEYGSASDTRKRYALTLKTP